MKKLLITVNNTRYEVEVEVLEDDEAPGTMPYYPIPQKSTDAISKSGVKTSSLFSSKVPTGKQELIKELQSPINGVILEIPIKVAQSVKTNDVLFVLESMKMKTNISSPRDGVVKQIHVGLNETIEAGKTLLTYE